MFEIDPGVPAAPRDLIEDAAMDACEENAPRKEVLAKAAQLMVAKLEKLKQPESIRRHFWAHSRLLHEMATVAPEAHDAVAAALFWGVADPAEIDRICDAANPMPDVA